MASASDHLLAAAPAPSAPSPDPSRHPHGADRGTSNSTKTSPPAAHDLTTTTNVLPSTNGIDASSSTSTLADCHSPPANVTSDISPAAVGPSSTSTAPPTSWSPFVNKVAISPSHSPSNSTSNNNGNSNRNSSDPQFQTSNSSAGPAIPVPSIHTPPRDGASVFRWASQPRQQHQAASIPAAKTPIAPRPTTEVATAKPSPAPRASVGFPSPKSDALRTNQKFLDDCDRITFGFQQSLPEAVRRSIRDNWEKCLLGSDFHQAFILNASIHHATPAAIQRGIRDFGKSLIASSKTQILQQMTTHDLDQVTDLILSKASVAFFDKVLEQRLKTIDAKRLINALARAERLGYEISDVQEEADDGDAAPAIQSYSQDSSPALSGPGPVLPAAQPGPVLHCDICFRRFAAQSAYNHHVKGKVCTRSPNSPDGFKYSCQHCGQGFTTPMGLQYHNANKVCGDFGEPAKPNLVRKSHVASPASGPVLPSRTPIPMSTMSPHVVTHRSSPMTPSASKAASPARSLVGTPNLTGDPYAHLSPEQLVAMQSELREAEIRFAERMRQANALPEPEKKARLDGLANSFGTKQSMIRKKYGVRLRNRRTKAEIQQERDRMQYKTAAEMQAEIGVVNRGLGRPLSGSFPSSQPGAHHGAAAGAAGSGWAPVNQPTTTLASNIAVPPPPRVTDSGDVSMHGGKRRLSGGEASDSKRVAYAEMGGLSGVQAEAETMDPTLPKGMGTKDEPVALDDSESESDDDSGSESGDEDIPAELPASVRQTLVRSSPAGGARLGSSS